MDINRGSAFTLIEVLIVVVIMAVLAATIVPQLSESSNDAKVSNARFHLQTLRAHIENYKSHHQGNAPGGDLAELLTKTNEKGTTSEAEGDLLYGPYIHELPSNPFTNSNMVAEITTDPATAGDVTETHGWLYNKATGNVWINDPTYVTE